MTLCREQTLLVSVECLVVLATPPIVSLMHRSSSDASLGCSIMVPPNVVMTVECIELGPALLQRKERTNLLKLLKLRGRLSVPVNGWNVLILALTIWLQKGKNRMSAANVCLAHCLS